MMRSTLQRHLGSFFPMTFEVPMFRSAVLGVGVAFLGACHDPFVAGTGCKQDLDCPSSGVCIDGVCRDLGACERDEHCGPCQKCADHQCVNQVLGEDLKNECPSQLCATGSCDGHGACGISPAGKVCRAAVGSCDAEEVCNGTSTECPADAVKPKGTSCGLCKACDASGQCTATPTDDIACGTVACSTLSSECTTYTNQTAGRCKAFGACRLVSPEDCIGQRSYKPQGAACGTNSSCDVHNVLTATTCDGKGTCVSKTEDCGLYTCDKKQRSCPTTCDAASDCVKSFCDLQNHTCPKSVTKVTCSQNSGNELQQAITNCPTSSRCYLRLAASTRCDSVKIDGKDVYIDGDSDASIVPQSNGAVAVSVGATKTETTRVGLAGLTIGGSSSAAGISATGSIGTPTPEVAIFRSVIQSNEGPGVIASRAKVTAVANAILFNAGDGLNVTSSSDLTLDRNRIIGNAGFGVMLSGSAFTITNNIIANNGKAESLEQGAGLMFFFPNPVSRKRFLFNTVTANGTANLSTSGGVMCVNAQVDLLDSIIVNNNGAEEVGCGALTGSNLDDNPQARSCGATDPMFVSPTNLHLSKGSPCIDKVPCDPSVTVDIDGTPRPTGASCDVGAYEYRP